MANPTSRKAPQKKTPVSGSPSGTSAPFVRNIALAFGALLALRLVAWRLPAERLWGLNHFAFLPDAGVALLAAFGLFACTPAFARLFRRIPFSGEMHGRALPVALVLVAGALFWMLRMQTYFLGDGAAYLAEIYRYIRGIAGSESVLYSKGSAPVTGWILAQFAKASYGLAGAPDRLLANPQFAFWALGAAAGMVFVAIAWKTAKDFGREAAERTALLLLLLCSAGTVFFFGYVEYYTFYYVAIAAHLYCSLRVLEGRGGLACAAGTLLLATAFHFMAVVAWPAFALLLLSRSPSERVRALVRPLPVFGAIGVVLLASGVYYFASGVATQGSRVVLSLSPFGREGAMQSYTLLSAFHLGDIVNYLFLLAAPLLVALLFLWRRETLRTAPVLVLLVYALFFSFLAVFGNLGFGMARDWDINAALGLVVLFLLIAVLRLTPPSARNGQILALAAGAAIVGCTSWLWVNLSPSASVERYKSILALDDRNIMGDYALNGYEHLRKYAFAQNDAPGVIWAIRKKIECVGYPTDYRKLALTVIQDAPPERKREEYDWMFDRLFEKINAMNLKRVEKVYSGRRSDYVELAAEAVLQCRYLPPRLGFDARYVATQQERLEALAPSDAIVGLARAQLEWIRTGAIADARPFREGADAVQGSSTLAAYAGIALGTLKEYEASALALRKAVSLDSSFALPLLYLAEAEMHLVPPETDAAERHLEQFLSNTSGSRVFGSRAQQEQLAERARAMLADLRAARAAMR
jgi:hypothetical protein